MPKGIKCPNCGRATLHQEGNNGLKCTQCDYEALRSDPNGPKPGKGQYCPMCKRWTVYNGVCNRCNLVVKS